MKKKALTIEHQRFLNRRTRSQVIVLACQLGLLVLFLGLWELLAAYEVIDSFITSSPSRIWATFIALEGRLDTMTAPQLEAALKEALPGVEALTFDLSKLDYISSAGLRVLLSAQKTMNQQGTMKVKNANEMILEIFEVTGFSDILTIE